MLKISVIIPVYNVEEYLERCLKSIVEQDYSDCEIILIDDGSTDRSGLICDDYKNKYQNFVVIHNNNMGVSKARECGVNNAKGEYLAFIDSDDYIDKDFFVTIKQYLKYDIVHFGYRIIKDEKAINEFIPKEQGIYAKNDIEEKIFPYLIQDINGGYYSPSLWSHVFRKKLFEENMVKDIKIAIGEDGACVMPCVYNAQSMVIINKLLYNYCFNSSSATKSKRVFDWDDPLNIYKHLSSKMDLTKEVFKDQIDRKIVHELMHIVVSRFYTKQRYGEIKRDINKHLKECEVYSNAIKNAKFKSLKGKILSFALKHKLFFTFKIYSLLG